MTEKNRNTEKWKESCIERFAPAVSALLKLKKENPEKTILIAIDGKCASGKTTLGSYLRNEFDANLFHMDDFFLQPHQRTAKRLSETGGNVDYERFKEEVLEAVLKGRTVSYQRYDCKTQALEAPESISPKQLNIIEGSYSQHLFFGDVYDLRVFMEINPEKQIENIRKRNGEEKLKDFTARWIPKEEAYFRTFRIKEKSDIIIEWKL